MNEWYLHSFFFIRTSNFDAEAERSYIFWRFEAETFLKMLLNLPDKLVGQKYKKNTKYFISHFLIHDSRKNIYIYMADNNKVLNDVMT